MGPRAGRICRLRVLMGAVLVGAVLTAAGPAPSQDLPIPERTLWESNMLTYGRMHCYAGTLDDTYYDAQRVYYQIADYTGDPTWTACAQLVEQVYRDQYVLPNNGSIPGYWNFTTGLRIDYQRSGDVQSRNAAIQLSKNAAYAADGTPLEWTQSADRSREVAYAILSYINAEMLGEPKRQRRIDLVNQAYDHMDQWFVRFAWPGPWQRSPTETGRLAPFMVGLTAHSLIRDWEETRDSRLIPSLRRAADWMWGNAWIPSAQAFWYDSGDRSNAAPDLNLLIAPLYAFLYSQTGETKYRDQGDALFAGGVKNAWLGNGKQFDQSYWWSFDYVNWRNAPADTSSPMVSLTSPANGSTVSGSAVTVSATASDDLGVAGVQFKLNGANLGAEVTAVPYTIAWNTLTAPNGTHTITAVARDGAGNMGSSTPVTVTVANADTTAPTVSLLSPTSGQTLAGVVTVRATASDSVGVTRVDYLLDGQLLAVFSPPSYTYGWDTTTPSNGPHILSVRAYDAAGNIGTAAVNVTIFNDTVAPTVSITASGADTTITGSITVSASASDNGGVVGVQFKLDGVNLGAEDGTAPYGITWNTTAAASGIHTLTAVARDAAGNSGTSAAVTVTVTNDTTPPVLSAVMASSVTSSGVTITWMTDEATDTQVEYGVSTAYGSLTTRNSALVTSHSQPLRGLAGGTLYHFRVRSRDKAGNLAVSADFTFTTPVVDLLVYRALASVTVDGALNEWSETSGAQLSGLSNSAIASLLWDATHLYLAFRVNDAELSAVQTARDASALYADDSVEVFIDTLNDRATNIQPDDYQFLVNLNNARGDLRGAGGWKDPAWNATWASGVTVQGTLNSPGDADGGYLVEMAIPWAQIGVVPYSGMVLSVDLVVNDRDPASSVSFNSFDWAGITSGSYARPALWRRVQLVDAP